MGRFDDIPLRTHCFCLSLSVYNPVAGLCISSHLPKEEGSLMMTE